MGVGNNIRSANRTCHCCPDANDDELAMVPKSCNLSTALWRPLYSLHGHSYLRAAVLSKSRRRLILPVTTASTRRMSYAPIKSNLLSPQDDFTRTDRYHTEFLIPKDEALEFAIKNSDDSGLPSIAVTAAQGKFLNLLARSINAKRILEVGTLGG